MISFDAYDTNPGQVLIDAVDDPIFRTFLEPGDIELVTIQQGGTQAQAQALSVAAVPRVVRRVIGHIQKHNLRITDRICAPSPVGFDFCSKASTPLGQLMRQLHDFLKGPFGAAGVTIANIFLPHPAADFLKIFTALLAIYGKLIKLCNC